jgi:hypothetical protein
MKTNVFLKARKIVPKIKYDKVDVNKDRIFSYEKVMTGFLEDLKMNTILGIDKIMNALRRWSKDFFTYLKNLTLTAILLAVLDPRRYWLRGVWVFSVFVAASKRVINFWRPSTWKAVPHKIVSKDRLDKRRMQEIVQSHGYPYEQYTVTTEDGYILTLERLPNRKSTKVYAAKRIFDLKFGTNDNNIDCTCSTVLSITVTRGSRTFKDKVLLHSQLLTPAMTCLLGLYGTWHILCESLSYGCIAQRMPRKYEARESEH